MASQVAVQGNESSTSANQNSSFNVSLSKNLSSPNQFINNCNLKHVNSTNNSNLLISSSQFLASMPSLVAAAVAGITTFHQSNRSLLPINQHLQVQPDPNTLNVNASQNSSNPNNSNTDNKDRKINSSGTPNMEMSTPATSNLSHDYKKNNIQSTLTNNSSLLDLIKCKLSSSFHIVDDPRVLECGATACLQCIILLKDSENKLKCLCCNNIHNIPANANKLIVNKNLEAFLSVNLQQINHLEDSMCPFDQKVQNQKSSIENFDQYLDLVQNDIHLKVEAMKTHLDKYAEQFIDNLKLIRKEVKKKWTDNSTALKTGKNLSFESSNPVASSPLQNCLLIQQYQHQLPLQQQLHNQQHQKNQQLSQTIKDDTIQINDLKEEPLVQLNTNPDVMTFLDKPSVQLNNYFHNSGSLLATINFGQSQTNLMNRTSSFNNIPVNSSQNQQRTDKQQHQSINECYSNESQNTERIANNDSNKQNIIQNSTDLNESLDELQNTFNFSNSSSWNANEDDMDDFESETINKPVHNTSANKQKRHLNKEQAQFNKFVRLEVSKKFGEDFLLQHEVNQLESSAMESIKNKAIANCLPKDTSITRAWTLAKVSLRSLKRDLRRKQSKLNLSSFSTFF